MTRYKIKVGIQIALAAVFLGSCTHQNSNVKDMSSFSSALNAHLEAIAQRDIENFEPTVAEDVSTIDPYGHKTDGKKAFLDFHKVWFAQSNWERKDSILTTSATDSTGHALIRYHYVQRDKSGNIELQIHAYQVLIFEKSDTGWQLVYDQNTEIRESK